MERLVISNSRCIFINGVQGDAVWSGVIEEISGSSEFLKSNCFLDASEYRNAKGIFGKLRKFWYLYVCYSVRVLCFIGKADFYIVATNPFFLPALLRLRLGGSRRMIMLVYDLYPDALELAKITRRGSIIANVVGAMTSYAIRNSSAAVFLGKSLKAHALSRYGSSKCSVVIPVGADGAPFAEFPPEQLSPTEQITVTYCGNLGRAHEIETLLELFHTDFSMEFKWCFHAFGAKYDALKLRLAASRNASNVVFGGPLASAAWVELMLQTHISLVTLDVGWENVVMPSKTYSSLVAGQAILAICPPESDLADLVRAHDCGWVVPVGEGRVLRKILDTEASDPDILLSKRRNAFNAGQHFYGCTAMANRWKELFRELENSS